MTPEMPETHKYLSEKLNPTLVVSIPIWDNSLAYEQ